MERCKWCRADTLDRVEYVEADLFGEAVRVVIVFCETCGLSIRTESAALPAGV
jgi:hypothetical protein